MLELELNIYLGCLPVISFITPCAQHERGKVIGVGVRIYYKIFNLSAWNIGIYCTQGRNISRGRRPREIFSAEGAMYAGISQGLGLNI